MGQAENRKYLARISRITRIKKTGQCLKSGSTTPRKKVKSSFLFFLPAPLLSEGLASGSELRSDFKLQEHDSDKITESGPQITQTCPPLEDFAD
jgi:hypothetical protein